MSHLHRCRFDMQAADIVTVRDDGVTIEAQQSWIDLGCTDSGKAREVAAAFHQLADRIDARDDAFAHEAVTPVVGRRHRNADGDEATVDAVDLELETVRLADGSAVWVETFRMWRARWLLALRDAAAGEVVA